MHGQQNIKFAILTHVISACVNKPNGKSTYQYQAHPMKQIPNVSYFCCCLTFLRKNVTEACDVFKVSGGAMLKYVTTWQTTGFKTVPDLWHSSITFRIDSHFTPRIYFTVILRASQHVPESAIVTVAT